MEENAPKRSRPDLEADTPMVRSSPFVEHRDEHAEKSELANPEEQKAAEHATEPAAPAPADSAVEGTPVEAKSKAKSTKARKKQAPAEQQPEFKNKFEHLKFVVNALAQDILLVYGGNKAAIERVRKGAEHVDHMCMLIVDFCSS